MGKMFSGSPKLMKRRYSLPEIIMRKHSFQRNKKLYKYHSIDSNSPLVKEKPDNNCKVETAENYVGMNEEWCNKHRKITECKNSLNDINNKIHRCGNKTIYQNIKNGNNNQLNNNDITDDSDQISNIKKGLDKNIIIPPQNKLMDYNTTNENIESFNNNPETNVLNLTKDKYSQTNLFQQPTNFENEKHSKKQFEFKRRFRLTKKISNQIKNITFAHFRKMRSKQKKYNVNTYVSTTDRKDKSKIHVSKMEDESKISFTEYCDVKCKNGINYTNCTDPLNSRNISEESVNCIQGAEKYEKMECKDKLISNYCQINSSQNIISKSDTCLNINSNICAEFNRSLSAPPIDKKLFETNNSIICSTNEGNSKYICEVTDKKDPNTCEKFTNESINSNDKSKICVNAKHIAKNSIDISNIQNIKVNTKNSKIQSPSNSTSISEETTTKKSTAAENSTTNASFPELGIAHRSIPESYTKYDDIQKYNTELHTQIWPITFNSESSFTYPSKDGLIVHKESHQVNIDVVRNDKSNNPNNDSSSDYLSKKESNNFCQNKKSNTTGRTNGPDNLENCDEFDSTQIVNQDQTESYKKENEDFFKNTDNQFVTVINIPGKSDYSYPKNNNYFVPDDNIRYNKIYQGSNLKITVELEPAIKIHRNEQFTKLSENNFYISDKNLIYGTNKNMLQNDVENAAAMFPKLLQERALSDTNLLQEKNTFGNYYSELPFVKDHKTVVFDNKTYNILMENFLPSQLSYENSKHLNDNNNNKVCPEYSNHDNEELLSDSDISIPDSLDEFQISSPTVKRTVLKDDLSYENESEESKNMRQRNKYDNRLVRGHVSVDHNDLQRRINTNKEAVSYFLSLSDDIINVNNNNNNNIYKIPRLLKQKLYKRKESLTKHSPTHERIQMRHKRVKSIRRYLPDKTISNMQGDKIYHLQNVTKSNKNLAKEDHNTQKLDKNSKLVRCKNEGNDTKTIDETIKEILLTGLKIQKDNKETILDDNKMALDSKKYVINNYTGKDIGEVTKEYTVTDKKMSKFVQTESLDNLKLPDLKENTCSVMEYYRFVKFSSPRNSGSPTKCSSQSQSSPSNGPLDTSEASQNVGNKINYENNLNNHIEHSHFQEDTKSTKLDTFNSDIESCSSKKSSDNHNKCQIFGSESKEVKSKQLTKNFKTFKVPDVETKPDISRYKYSRNKRNFYIKNCNKKLSFNGKIPQKVILSKKQCKFDQKFDVIPEEMYSVSIEKNVENLSKLERPYTEKFDLPDNIGSINLNNEHRENETKFKSGNYELKYCNDEEETKWYENDTNLVNNIIENAENGKQIFSITDNRENEKSTSTSNTNSECKNASKFLHRGDDFKQSQLHSININENNHVIRDRILKKLQYNAEETGDSKNVTNETKQSQKCVAEKQKNSCNKNELKSDYYQSHKGRDALSTKTSEHEEQITLTKGWINFYLLKNNHEDHSTFEDTEDNRPTDYKVSDDSLNEVQHYTLHIHASPEKENFRLSRTSGNENKKLTNSNCLPEITKPTPVNRANDFKFKAKNSDHGKKINNQLPRLHQGIHGKLRWNNVEKCDTDRDQFSKSNILQDQGKKRTVMSEESDKDDQEMFTGVEMQLSFKNCTKKSIPSDQKVTVVFKNQATDLEQSRIKCTEQNFRIDCLPQLTCTYKIQDHIYEANKSRKISNNKKNGLETNLNYKCSRKITTNSSMQEVKSGKLHDELNLQMKNEAPTLTVKGSTMSREKRPHVPVLSERDLIRMKLTR